MVVHNISDSGPLTPAVVQTSQNLVVEAVDQIRTLLVTYASQDAYASWEKVGHVAVISALASVFNDATQLADKIKAGEETNEGTLLVNLRNQHLALDKVLNNLPSPKKPLDAGMKDDINESLKKVESAHSNIESLIGKVSWEKFI